MKLIFMMKTTMSRLGMQPVQRMDRATSMGVGRGSCSTRWASRTEQIMIPSSKCQASHLHQLSNSSTCTAHPLTTWELKTLISCRAGGSSRNRPRRLFSCKTKCRAKSVRRAQSELRRTPTVRERQTGWFPIEPIQIAWLIRNSLHKSRIFITIMHR